MKKEFIGKWHLIIWLLFIIAIILTYPPKTYSQQPNTTTVTELSWPRQITKDGNTIVYYQPQIDDWKDYKELKGDIAFAFTPQGGKEVLGVASFQANTIVDKDAHTAFLRDINVTSVRFPSLDATKAQAMEQQVRTMFPKGGETISIDRLIADLNQKKNTNPPTVQVKNDPPPIFYSPKPAILLIVQGDPAWVPIENLDVQYLVNANWDVLMEKSKKKYYLLADPNWLTADNLKGPWTPTKTLPADMSKLPPGKDYDYVSKFVPPPAAPGTPPEVFFSDVPAELIEFNGPPAYSKIAGTSLSYATNTDNDVFIDNNSKRYYTLLSGRWFSAQSLNGPWTYAGNNLPADFAKIPENTPISYVLASVPGTQQAKDAVLLAQIPTSAVVNKKQAAAQVQVNYAGNSPQFQPITGTSMQYATNTQEKVIKLGDRYYLCYQGVWFMSSSPNGPWQTCSTVPPEIYNIPPSSPVYNVTYVTQNEVDDETVESSTAAGYFGAFVVGVGVGACLVYGTGWYYPPYYYYGGGYPVYWPSPYTYGAGYAYNPVTGGYVASQRIYGPYGAAGTSAWYNPNTGRYGRSASVQGPYGGRTVAGAYNPNTGAYGATRQGHNPYAQWGSSVATKGGQWAQTGHVTTARGTTAGYKTTTGQQGVIHTGDNGTVVKGNNSTFAGKDGNVYQKDANGNWNKYENGSWQPINRNDNATRQQLNQDATARDRGQMQSQNFERAQRNGGFQGGGFEGRGAGGFQGGGGFRGGGGGGFRGGGGGGFRGGGRR